MSKGAIGLGLGTGVIGGVAFGFLGAVAGFGVTPNSQDDFFDAVDIRHSYEQHAVVKEYNAVRSINVDALSAENTIRSEYNKQIAHFEQQPMVQKYHTAQSEVQRHYATLKKEMDHNTNLGFLIGMIGGSVGFGLYGYSSIKQQEMKK